LGERDTPEQLKARALRHLVRREHSRAELARKLAAHAASREDLEALLASLVATKRLCDARYAEERARVLARKYGAAKIRHDLKANCISDGIVGAVSSEGELERARAILERKYRLPAATREERAKRARFLQGRGFSSDVVLRLVLDREDAS
jgi:regulatory protein